MTSVEAGQDQPVILVVDDDARNRLVMRVCLENEFQVLDAVDGPSALSQIEKRHIDMVLLDVMMPGMSGFEVCRILKARPAPYLPVLMLTALNDQRDRTEGLEAGADDFLTKPIDRHELLLRVRCFLRLQQQERTIRTQFEQLQALAALKDDLVSLIVHDLRNPLAGVLGFMSVLQRTLTNPVQREHVANAVEAGQKLDDTLEDLLQVRMLEEGHLMLRRMPASLRTIVDSAIGSVAGDALDRSVSIVSDYAVDDNATVDARMLRRAVENLLSNALKYSCADAVVNVSVAPRNGGMEIAVADRGPSIPEPAKRQLFSKFGAVVSDKSNTRRSHGLGLYLVRLVAGAHDGAVHVADRPGGGTVFSMWLPPCAQRAA